MDFLSGSDRFRFSQAGIRIGDGDTAIDAGLSIGGPGGFAPGNELVIFTADIVGAITASGAAARIGAAGASYAPGRRRCSRRTMAARAGCSCSLRQRRMRWWVPRS